MSLVLPASFSLPDFAYFLTLWISSTQIDLAALRMWTSEAIFSMDNPVEFCSIINHAIRSDEVSLSASGSDVSVSPHFFSHSCCIINDSLLGRGVVGAGGVGCTGGPDCTQHQSVLCNAAAAGDPSAVSPAA